MFFYFIDWRIIFVALIVLFAVGVKVFETVSPVLITVGVIIGAVLIVKLVKKLVNKFFGDDDDNFYATESQDKYWD